MIHYLEPLDLILNYLMIEILLSKKNGNLRLIQQVYFDFLLDEITPHPIPSPSSYPSSPPSRKLKPITRKLKKQKTMKPKGNQMDQKL